MSFMDTYQLSRYETWELDAMVAQIERPNPWLVNRYFNREKLFTSRTIEFDLLDRGRRLAPFVSPVVAGKPMRREGYRTKQLSPAYIKPTDLVLPQDGFTRRPGEPYGGRMTPQQRVDQLVAETLDQHQQMIDNRLEWMAAQALVTGGITITGEDYPTTYVDFGRDSSLTVGLTGSAKWNTATAAPLEDIETYALAVRKISKGAVVTDLIMTGDAWNLLKKFSSVTDLIDVRFRRSLGEESRIDAAPRVNINTGIYMGTLNGRIDIWVYDAYYQDDTGADQPYLPPYTVLGIAGGAMEGTQYFGAIIDLDASIQARRSFSKSDRKFNPSGIEIVTQSAPLLAPRRTDTMFVLTVV